MGLFSKFFGDDGDEKEKENKSRHTNQQIPIELQKHIENQMREILKTFEHFDENVKVLDQNALDEFVDPEFEKQLKELLNNDIIAQDLDLDGKINTDQIETLLQQIPKANSPKSNMSSSAGLESNLNSKKIKRSDIERIMDRIHGTVIEEKSTPRTPTRSRLPGHQPTPIPQHKMPFAPPPGFDRFNNATVPPQPGFKSFGQSIITQTFRKPDGSYEIRRIVKDSDGNTKTTVTRSQDGKTETVTSYGNSDEPQSPQKLFVPKPLIELDQNFYVSTDGYTMPKNMW